MKHILFVFLFFLSSVFSSRAQTGLFVPQLAKFDTAMLNLLSQYNVPGGELAITYQGRLVYNRGFGYADTTSHSLVQPNSVFRLASVSKPITAITVMHLIEKGILNLNDTVFGTRGILNDTMYHILDARVYNITIRNLLNHSGGWDRNISGDPMFNAYNIATIMGVVPPANSVTVIRYVLSHQMLDFIPASQYQYSNFGFCILGRVIEKVTGRRYEDYVRDTILLPLHINDMYSGFNLINNKLPNEVTYYDYPTAPSATSIYNGITPVPWQYGGFNIEAMDSHGAWVASAEDLCRLLVAVDGFSTKPDILLPATIDTMIKPSTSNVNYALGWGVNSNNNWWHTGSLPGTTTEIVRGGNQLNWAILLNTRPANPNNLTSAVDNLVWNIIPSILNWTNNDLFICTQTYDTIDKSICNGSSFSVGTSSFNSSGTFTIQLTNQLGCDSIVVLHLTINQSNTGSFSITKCGGSYLFNGINHTNSGTFKDTLTNSHGCDSIITLHLTINPIKSTSIYDTICGNHFYYFNGHNRTTTGTYLDTLQTYLTCDSFITLHLKVYPVATHAIYDTTCSNHPYLFKGINHISSGTFRDTLFGANYHRCDSIITLYLKVYPTVIHTIHDTTCANVPVIINNHSHVVSGTFYDTIIGGNYHHCDSIVKWVLTVLPLKTKSISQSICSGDSLWFYGRYLKIAATYKDTLQNSHSCDSVITLTLTVRPKSYHTITHSICSGNSYFFNGHNIINGGNYNDTLINYRGCDSVLTLILTVNPLKTKSISQSICTGDSIWFYGHYLKANGSYNDTVASAVTCDTVVTLHLTLNPLPVVHLGNDTTLCNNATITLNAGSGFTNYLWNNNSTNQTLVVHNANTYFVKVTDNNGCKGSDTIIVKYTVCTGINDVTINDMLKVYPNPTSNILIVEFMNDVKEATKFEVYNAAGQLMQANTFDIGTNKQIKLSLQNYATGNYILKIKNSKMDYSMQVNKTQ